MYPLPSIYINNYEFNFKPFAYRLNLEGRIEINSKYKIDLKILYGILDLPNQKIDFINLIPDKKTSCQKNSSDKCQVFRFSTFINLSGDKYFAREFKESEDIPFQFSFAFDTNNLDSLKSYNHALNKSVNYRENNQHLLDFISEIELLKISSSFRYKNSFSIHRHKYQKSLYSLQIPKTWSIYKDRQVESYETIFISLKKYDDLKDTYIDDWFSIRGQAKVILDSCEIELSDGNKLSVPVSYFKARNSKDWNNFYLDVGIRNNLVDLTTKGIYYPQKTSGNLVNKLTLLTNNHGYQISLKNHFSFEQHPLLDASQNLKIRVLRNPAPYLPTLRRFKFISL
ncbi:hypothetical protein MHSWG343_01050 [Candidatus Mycoplasma haematohominis]|uniref:Uncharacterized protein n=1 Tax=Candidatus Mycoplasma haematohominis TaxID=1494318 RepID=A0A478FPZ0_9MOLU|nr:hypothetical protein MHSWG343_01050 [Candidatus Mycoplasma haemohominis]